MGGEDRYMDLAYAPETPVIPGFYWCLFHGSKEPVLVRLCQETFTTTAGVTEARFFRNSRGRPMVKERHADAFDQALFAGPLVPPPLPSWKSRV